MARFLSPEESTCNYAQQFIRPLFSTLCIVITEKKNKYTALTLKDRLKNGDAFTGKRSREKHIHHLFIFCIDSNGLFPASIPNLTCLAPYQTAEARMFRWFATSPVFLVCPFLLLTHSSCLGKHPLRLHQSPATLPASPAVSSCVCMSMSMPSLPFQGGTISFVKLPWVYSGLSCAGPLYNSYLPNTSNKYLANNFVYGSVL